MPDDKPPKIPAERAVLKRPQGFSTLGRNPYILLEETMEEILPRTARRQFIEIEQQAFFDKRPPQEQSTRYLLPAFEFGPRQGEVLDLDAISANIRQLTARYIDEPRAPLDNIEPLLRIYNAQLAADEQRWTKLTGKVKPRNQAEVQAFLDEAYTRHRTAVLQQFAPAIAMVKHMSRTTVQGYTTKKGKIVMQTKTLGTPDGGKEWDSMSREQLLACTAFSIPVSQAKVEETRFEKGITRPGMPNVTKGLYKLSSILSDERARAQIEQELEKREAAMDRQMQKQLNARNPTVHDLLTIGMSTHASNAISVLRFLRPDMLLGGIDKYRQPGYLWSIRNWIRQNNTIGAANLETGNLPRQGGDLFPIGNFGSIRVPYVSHGRWPSGKDAGISIRWNLTTDLDTMLLNHEVIGVERSKKAKYAIIVKHINTGKDGRMLTDAFIYGTIGEEKNPFRGKKKQAASAAIYDAEIAKAARGEPSLIYNFNLFSQRIQTNDGMQEFLFEQDNGEQQAIGVAGAGDGGNCVVQQTLDLLGRNPSSAQVSRRGPQIVWYDQRAKTTEAFSRKTRGLYSQICTGYTSDRIEPKNKLDRIEYGPNGLFLYERTRKGDSVPCFVNKLVMTTGNMPAPYQTLFSGLGKPLQNLTDAEGRVVAKQFEGERAYLIGPASGITVQESGADIVEIFQNLGIEQNLIANWRHGYASQRSAVELAMALPMGRRKMPAQGGPSISDIFAD